MSDATSTTNGASNGGSRPKASKPAVKVPAEERSFSLDEARAALGDAAAEMIHARRQAARKVVRGRPATAIAGALALGVIIGLMARR